MDTLVEGDLYSSLSVANLGEMNLYTYHADEENNVDSVRILNLETFEWTEIVKPGKKTASASGRGLFLPRYDPKAWINLFDV